MASIVAKDGQSAFDLALQLYGDVSKVIELVELNSVNIPNVMANNLAGKEIVYDETKNDVTNFYKNNNIDVATRDPEIYTSAAFDSSFDKSFN